MPDIVHIIECYAIRQKSTGNFLPQAHKARKGGFTHDEPVLASDKLPRLFSLPRHAKQAMNWWLAGVTSAYHYQTGSPWDIPDWEEGIKTVPVQERKADDMEIVTVRLTVIGN